MREFGFPGLAGGLVVVEANAAGLQAGLDLEGLAVGVHFFALLEEVVEGGFGFGARLGVETAEGGGFVVVGFEQCIETGDGQQFLEALGGVEEFECTAASDDGGVGADDLAEARAIDGGDGGTIDEQAVEAGVEFLDESFAEEFAAGAEGHGAGWREDPDASGEAASEEQRH